MCAQRHWQSQVLACATVLSFEPSCLWGGATLFPLSRSAAPHEAGRRQASEAKEDSKIAGNGAAVVCVDDGPLKSRCVSSGEQVHPRVSFIWQDLGVGIVSWHWEHSRAGEPLRPTFPRKQNS